MHCICWLQFTTVHKGHCASETDKRLLSRTVEFTGSIRLTIKKDEFLRNVDNKNRIIHAIGNKLTMFGCTVSYALNDADVLIATSAVTSANSYPTCVIRNDTNLLILLIYQQTKYHADQTSLIYILKPKHKISISTQ